MKGPALTMVYMFSSAYFNVNIIFVKCENEGEI